jgi:hypothetical protein
MKVVNIVIILNIFWLSYAQDYSLDFTFGQYARIPMSENLSNFESFTLEFWYFQTGFQGGDEKIVGTEYFAGPEYSVDNQHGDWASIINDGNGNYTKLDYWDPDDNTPQIVENEWHHFAVCYDGTTSYFFLNGLLLKSEDVDLDPFGPVDQDLVINRHTWDSGSSSRLSGQLDELRISNIARYTDNFSVPVQEFSVDEYTKGLWHFNEGSGNQIIDESGNGNHGILVNGAGWSTNTPGLEPSENVSNNYSLSFDGVDDYIEVPDIGSLNAFTFEMWVRIDGNIGQYRGLFGTQDWGIGRVHWEIIEDNTWECGIDDGSTYGVHGTYLFNENILGQWLHLAASYQSGGTVKLFVNGVLDAEVAVTQTVNLTDLRIGDVFTQPRFFNGIIDEVRISNIDRYTENFTTPDDELIPDNNTIALWHFNEGSGNIVYDASGNGNDGTIHGATWSSETPPINTTTNSELAWSVQLKSSISDYNDNDNYLGVAENATNYFDSDYDEVEPPESLGDYVQLYFPHPEWNNPLGDEFSKDIRPEIVLTDTMQVWDFEVLSTNSGEVTLTFVFTDVPSIPIILENTATGERQTLTNNATYTFTSVADSAHPFRISIGDTTPPTLTLGANCSGPAILNSDSIRTLNWTTSDGYSVDSIEVWFSADSGTTYSKVVSLGAVSSYDWIVPDTTIVYHGLLKIMSKDYAGNVAEKLSDYIFAIVGDSISTTVTSGWNLWSAPIDPANDTMTANLDDDFTDYWVTYNYVNNGYTYDGILKETEGYWLGTVQNATIDVKGTALTSDQTMNLSQGWDLVSNPLVLDVSVDSLEFTKDGVTKDYSDAVSTGWVNSIYGYSGSGYETTTTLLPWKGYWIGVLETNLSMTFPIHRKPTSRSTRTRDYGWIIAFEAQASNSNDRTLVIGIDEMATNGFDNEFDAVRPPNPPGPEYISLFISHPEWNYFLGDKFSSDIRGGIPENGFQEWHVETEATEENIELSWSLHGVPDELELGIDLNSDGNFSDMRILENVLLESNTSFVVRIGIGVLKVTDQIVPLSFALYQNFPNPFNPSTSIQYDLPERTHVTLVIYDLLGREIRTLVKGVQEPGHKSVIWNGVDEFGNPVGSGIYICRINTQNYSRTIKLLLVR